MGVVVDNGGSMSEHMPFCGFFFEFVLSKSYRWRQAQVDESSGRLLFRSKRPGTFLSPTVDRRNWMFPEAGRHQRSQINPGLPGAQTPEVDPLATHQWHGASASLRHPCKELSPDCRSPPPGGCQSL